MSVAILPSFSVMEPYLFQQEVSRPFSSSPEDTDSDGRGYGTLAEVVVAEMQAVASSAPVEAAENDESCSVVADPELQERIVKQVEWYFSDENLLKDSFLMKHINRNKQGYVSLKLVASLRKVKTLAKDWRIVLESLKHSDLLALNEDETKIRRLSPAPQVDYSHTAKTLLITNYPEKEPNLAHLEQSYGKYGEVVRVRVIHPGRAIPLDVKPCKTQHLSLGKELCILVQYESETVAKSVLKKITEQLSWRDEMKVTLLGSGSEQEPKDQLVEKSTRSGSSVELRKKKGNDSKSPESQAKQRGAHHSSRDYHSPSLRGSREVTPVRQILQRKPSPPTPSSSPDTQQRYGKSHSSKTPEFMKKYLRPDSRKDYSSSDSGISTCGSRSASESPKLTPEPSRKFFSSSFGELSWRSGDKQRSHANSCVVRQPLGPDGTKGFAKQRVIPISIAIQSC